MSEALGDRAEPWRVLTNPASVSQALFESQRPPSLAKHQQRRTEEGMSSARKLTQVRNVVYIRVATACSLLLLDR